MACWSRYKSTPHASRCWIVSSKSLSERPGRSIAHAMTISNFRRLASLSMESRPGRPFRPLAPEQLVASSTRKPPYRHQYEHDYSSISHVCRPMSAILNRKPEQEWYREKKESDVT